MLLNSPLNINVENWENLFLVLNDDHVAISISVRLEQLAVEVPGDLVFASLVWIPEHHSDQEQILAVNLGDVRELGEVDAVAVGKARDFHEERHECLEEGTTQALTQNEYLRRERFRAILC